jgi:hypothetical protein
MHNTWATYLFNDLKELIYPLEAPQRVRSVPMQVFAVGPARSGTDLLRAALVELGYDYTYHGYDIALSPPDDKASWKLYRRRWHSSSSHGGPGRQITATEFDTVIGHCSAINDFDAACFARDIILAYPDAKVILNVPERPRGMVPKLPEHHSLDEGRLEDVDPKFLLQRVILGARERFAVSLASVLPRGLSPHGSVGA